HRAILLRTFRQRQVLARSFPLAAHASQRRTLGRQRRLRLSGRAFPRRQGTQLLLQPGTQRRCQQTLTHAAEYKTRRQQPVDVVVLAPRAMTLLIQAAQITERRLIRLTIQWPAASHIERPAAQRIACW